MTLAATLPSSSPGRDKLRVRRLEGAGPLRCRGCRGWWERLQGQAEAGWRRGREAPWGKQVRREVCRGKEVRRWRWGAGLVQGRWQMKVQGRWQMKALEGRS